MDPPELHVFVDGVAWTRLAAPPEIAPRDWILGVVAVQLTVEDGRPQALLRANATGAAPSVRALGPSLVQIALVSPESAPPALPRLALPAASGATARVALALDTTAVDEIALSPAALSAAPSPRAFGHVFCRWLRSGAIEPGFDLTDFLSLAPGAKYERRVSRPLAVGEVVSYALAL